MYRILVIVFFLCTGHIFSQENYNLFSIPSDLTAHANSVVMEEYIEVDASNIKKMKVKTRRVVAVLNKLGANDARSYEYYNENARVKKIGAEVYDAFGNRKKRFKKKDFKDVSRSGGSMYLDSRVLYLDFIPTFFPYIMVYESEVESGDSGLLSSHWFLQGYAESLLKSEMRIRYASDNKIRYKPKNLEGYDVTISENPNELVLTAENIPALTYEEYSPSATNIFPHVLLAFNKFQLKNVMATVEDWKGFGTWMENALLGDVGRVSDATLQKINALIANEPTHEAKARKIYQYVQDKVRYVSIQIGIGGWKPMPASEVDELSYGDCKALTNYTKALLDAVGIPSYYSIVYGSDTQQNMDEDFASIQGNHVILGIPDGEEITWLECTSQDLPFGYIGSFTDDRNVVALTPEGGKLIRTKTYTAAENLQQTRALVKLDEKGGVQAEFESTSKGLQYEDKYFLSKRKSDEVDRFYKHRWNYINRFSLVDFQFENNREEVAFTEKLNIGATRYAAQIGRDFIFNPNMFNQLEMSLPQIKNRRQNLKIDRGFMDEDRIVYELPKSMKIEVMPESQSMENGFGEYEIRFTKLSDRSFEYYRKFLLKKGEYPPEKYEPYRQFMKSISQFDRTKILVTENK